MTGCEKLHFDPSLQVQPETTKADEPSGMAVDLKVPQNTDPHGLSTPPFKSVTVTLPSGVSLSPGSADGLQACTEAQFEFQSNDESSCPNASVLGTVTATTPLLPAPLTGYVFLGQPECDPCTNQDATDGKMFKLWIQIEGEGIVQKVQGTVAANTTTGQLTATFPNNPQFPVQRPSARLQGRPARRVGDAAELREVHGDLGNGAVEHPVHADRDTVHVVRYQRERRRRSVPLHTAVDAVLQRWYFEPERGAVQPPDVDVR